MTKGSKIYSVVNNKCPRCQEGDFFISKNAYSLKRFGEMKDACSECGLKYTMETGFYFGAAYVSYALGVATMVAAWVATSWLVPEISALYQVLVIVGCILILAPLNFRISRLIWINFFVKYKPSLG